MGHDDCSSLLVLMPTVGAGHVGLFLMTVAFLLVWAPACGTAVVAVTESVTEDAPRRPPTGPVGA